MSSEGTRGKWARAASSGAFDPPSKRTVEGAALVTVHRIERHLCLLSPALAAIGGRQIAAHNLHGLDHLLPRDHAVAVDVQRLERGHQLLLRRLVLGHGLARHQAYERGEVEGLRGRRRESLRLGDRLLGVRARVVFAGAVDAHLRVLKKRHIKVVHASLAHWAAAVAAQRANRSGHRRELVGVDVAIVVAINPSCGRIRDREGSGGRKGM